MFTLLRMFMENVGFSQGVGQVDRLSDEHCSTLYLTYANFVANYSVLSPVIFFSTKLHEGDFVVDLKATFRFS